jgi:tetratricopeptide (TPR) repeat protein
MRGIIKTKTLAAFCCVSLLIINPVRADFGLSVLLEELAKGALESFGSAAATWAMQKASDLWYGERATPDPVQVQIVRGELDQASHQLHDIDPKLEDIFKKLRDQTTTTTTQQEYIQNVLAFSKDLDVRLKLLEQNDKKQDATLKAHEEQFKTMIVRLADLEKRQDATEARMKQAEAHLQNVAFLHASVSALGRAQTFEDNGDHVHAIAELTDALSPLTRVKKSFVQNELPAHFRNAIAYTLMARADSYRTLTNDELAIADYTSALAVNPTHSQQIECLTTRGDLLRHRSRIKLAVTDYTKAIELQPSAKLYIKRASAFESLGDSRLAERDIELAQTLQSKQ